MALAILMLREGSYFPGWLLERRRWAGRALTTVVATCYLLEVLTRQMEKLVDALGITRLSKSQVSVMTAELDAQVVWSIRWSGGEQRGAEEGSTGSRVVRRTDRNGRQRPPTVPR